MARDSLSERLILGGGRLNAGALKNDSMKILEAAYELGIRKFDLAPVYGEGNAERIVADIFAGVMHQIQITTKVGIQRPMKRTKIFSLINNSKLYLKSKVKRLYFFSNLKNKVTVSSVGNMDVDFIRDSFDESLHQLRVSAVDTLLLHEPRLWTVTDQAKEYLSGLKEAGVVRKLGTGTGLAIGDAFVYGDVIQVKYDKTIWECARPSLRELRVHGLYRSVDEVNKTAVINKILSETDINIVYSTTDKKRLTSFVGQYFSNIEQSS